MKLLEQRSNCQKTVDWQDERVEYVSTGWQRDAVGAAGGAGAWIESEKVHDGTGLAEARDAEAV